MGWETVNLADVEVQTGFTPVPSGTYTLRILGASYDERFPGQLNINTEITDGEYTRRRVFGTLPDPAVQAWSPRALKVLAIAVGADAVDGEDPVSFLNRIAANGHATFSATVEKLDFTKKDGSAGSKNRIQFFTARPAA